MLYDSNKKGVLYQKTSFIMRNLKSDHLHYFPVLIHMSRFNRRRGRFAELTVRLNYLISSLLKENEDSSLVDSNPVPICINARINRIKICKADLEIVPDRRCSAVNKSYFHIFTWSHENDLKPYSPSIVISWCWKGMYPL